MSILSDLNTLVTLILSIFVIASSFCRFVIIKMHLVQYRYVAPIVLAHVFALFVFFGIIGGEKPDYFMPVALAAFGLWMLNNRNDWKEGIPSYMLRTSFVSAEAGKPGNATRRQQFQNFVVGTGMAVTVGVTGTAAMDRGDPLQIISAHAEPKVTTPNGTLDIVYTLRRTRVCAGAVDRFIVRADNDQPVQSFGSTPIGAAKIGVLVEGLRVKIQLANLPVGNYIYRTTVTHYCDDSPAPYIKRTPDVPFIVAPAPVPLT